MGPFELYAFVPHNDKHLWMLVDYFQTREAALAVAADIKADGTAWKLYESIMIASSD